VVNGFTLMGKSAYEYHLSKATDKDKAIQDHFWSEPSSRHRKFSITFNKTLSVTKEDTILPMRVDFNRLTNIEDKCKLPKGLRAQIAELARDETRGYSGSTTV
jgi:hypothetical protein